MGHPEVK